MIQHQESPRLNYRPSRTNFHNYTKEGFATDRPEEPLHIYDPRPKLTLIEKSLQKLADKQLMGHKYVQEYLLAQYRRNRSINTIRASFDSIQQFFIFLKIVGRKKFGLASRIFRTFNLVAHWLRCDLFFVFKFC